MIQKHLQPLRIPLNPEESLEAVFSSTTKPDYQNLKVAILCHPHPRGGGTFHNKVVTALDRAYLSLGIDTLKFQFRGSGGSGGEFTDGELEHQDIALVSEFMQEHYDKKQFFYAGFSFGAAMAYKFVSSQPAIEGLQSPFILVAPPVDKDYFPETCKMPVITNCILATQDELIDYQASLAFMAELKKANQNGPEMSSVDVISGHFFHGLISEVTSLVISLLLPHVDEKKL